MKDSKWAHEKKSSDIQNASKYSIKYTTSPKKSYVIEPKEGKIHYEESRKKEFCENLSK